MARTPAWAMIPVTVTITIWSARNAPTLAVPVLVSMEKSEI